MASLSDYENHLFTKLWRTQPVYDAKSPNVFSPQFVVYIMRDELNTLLKLEKKGFIKYLGHQDLGEDCLSFTVQVKKNKKPLMRPSKFELYQLEIIPGSRFSPESQNYSSRISNREFSKQVPRKLRLNGKVYSLTPHQGFVLIELHKAWRSDNPEMNEQIIIKKLNRELDDHHQVKATSLRYIFKTLRIWRKVIVPGTGRGMYRLKLNK